jgi:hypothetical protein
MIFEINKSDNATKISEGINVTYILAILSNK